MTSALECALEQLKTCEVRFYDVPWRDIAEHIRAAERERIVSSLQRLIAVIHKTHPATADGVQVAIDHVANIPDSCNRKCTQS